MLRRWIFAIAISISMPAFAQPRTADCADSLPSLAKIIVKYRHVIKPAVIGWFVGVWKKKKDVLFYGPVEITIDKSTKLTFSDALMRLCPQEDGSFYLYNQNQPSEYATISINSDTNLTVYKGTGRLANLEDLYTKISHDPSTGN